jgi:hypothetical protein
MSQRGGPDVGTLGGYARDPGLCMKNNSFFKKRYPNCDFFMIVSPFWSSYNLMGGSGVRSKADLIWVRKVIIKNKFIKGSCICIFI